jgi:hypothetical protein
MYEPKEDSSNYISHSVMLRIRNGVMNPNDPIANDTIGGTGPLNIEAVWTILSKH